MPLPLQKYLGWLSRYLYAVETGPIQVPAPVIDVANEPFAWRMVTGSGLTVVGTVTVPFVTPENRRRLYLWGMITGAPAFTAGDDFQLSVVVDGLNIQTRMGTNIAAAFVNEYPLINSVVHDGTAGLIQEGVRQIATGPGDTLQLLVGSAAGGTTFNVRLLCIDVPAYAPFPNVF